MVAVALGQILLRIIPVFLVNILLSVSHSHLIFNVTLVRSYGPSTGTVQQKMKIIPYSATMARMGEERGVYRVLVGKPEGRRPLGRPRRRWVDNITLDLQEVGCGYMDWIGLAQDRDRWRTLGSAVMNLRVP